MTALDLSAPLPAVPPLTPTPLHGNAVARQHVHKAAMAEVLLTGWHRHALRDAFTVTAQWPRAHSFYTPHQGLHDPLLLAETVRQTIPLLSHGAYDVPFGHHLAWSDFSFRIEPAALRAREVCAEVTLHIACHDIVHRRDMLSSLRMQVTVERDGIPLGSATAHFTSHAPAIYTRLRGGNSDAHQAMSRALPLPRAIPAGRVTRYRDQDVVLAPTDSPDRWQLRVDTTHPVLFDHPVDHVPGMLLLEAARQSAQVAAGTDTVLLELDARFSKYAELDRPCDVRIVPSLSGAPGLTTTHVAAHQDGVEVFTARCTSRDLAGAEAV